MITNFSSYGGSFDKILGFFRQVGPVIPFQSLVMLSRHLQQQKALLGGYPVTPALKIVKGAFIRRWMAKRTKVTMPPWQRCTRITKIKQLDRSAAIFTHGNIILPEFGRRFGIRRVRSNFLYLQITRETLIIFAFLLDSYKSNQEFNASQPQQRILLPFRHFFETNRTQPRSIPNGRNFADPI